MKKHLLSTLTLLFFNAGYSQVGINTDNPRATLDVNGTLRVSRRGNGDNDDKMLTTSATGIVNERSLNEVMIRKFRTTLTVASGQTTVVKNDLDFQESNIFVTSVNGCNRNMITSFLSSDGALTLTGGIARDKVANYTIESIPPGQPSYSPRMIVKFNSVITCSQDKGNGTQFDFALKKLNNTEYEIRNDGNVQRLYEIVWQEID